MADSTKQQGDTALVERQAEKDKGEVHTPEIITTQEEYSASQRLWEQRHYNLLTPFAKISGLAPAHGVIATVVQISVDPNDNEAFTNVPYLRKDQYALAKRGLRKVAEGIGISTQLEYISVNQIRHYWHVKAIASYRGIDGAIQMREASQEWDLRDVSERIKGWTKNQIDEGRKYGLRNCETRAINAAIRECGCGIKQAYYKDELARAFVAVRVALNPDMSDPDQKRAVIQAFYGAKSLLYPGSSRIGPDNEPMERGLPEQSNTDAEPEPPERMTTAGLPEDAEALVIDDPATEKPAADTYHVTKGVQRGKGEATQYFFETTEGQVLFTSDLGDAKLLKAAWRDGQPRKVSTEAVLVKGERYRQVIEVVPAGRLV